jgi:CRP/FNR family cyclic AMP-dependent transcriptional regulator
MEDRMRHVHSDERIELLKGVWLFDRCTRKELAVLARMATPIIVEPGRSLTKEGTAGTEFIVVVEGVASAMSDGDEIGQVGPGSFFGELALLDGGPRTASVRAETPMLALVWSKSEFDALVDRSIPSVARKMLVTLAERLRAERLRAERFRHAALASNAERLNQA